MIQAFAPHFNVIMAKAVGMSLRSAPQRVMSAKAGMEMATSATMGRKNKPSDAFA